MWGAVDTERCQWRRDVLGAYGVNPDALEGVSQRSCMVGEGTGSDAGRNRYIVYRRCSMGRM